jgi:hypothetical protein
MSVLIQVSVDIIELDPARCLACNRRSSLGIFPLRRLDQPISESCEWSWEN